MKTFKYKLASHQKTAAPSFFGTIEADSAEQACSIVQARQDAKTKEAREMGLTDYPRIFVTDVQSA